MDNHLSTRFEKVFLHLILYFVIEIVFMILWFKVVDALEQLNLEGSPWVLVLLETISLHLSHDLWEHLYQVLEPL